MNQVPISLRKVLSKWPLVVQNLAVAQSAKAPIRCSMVSHIRPAANSKSFAAHHRIPMKYVEELKEVINDNHERISELATLMKCNRSDVELLVRRDSRILTYTDPKKVDDIIRLVMEHGFTYVDIVTNPRILMRSLSTLQRRLPEMAQYKRYRFQLHQTVCTEPEFVRCMEESRRESEEMGDCPSRLSFAAQLLECQEVEVAEQVEKGFRKLVSLPPSVLRERVSLIKSYGLSGRDILARALMLRCPAVEAADRLELVSEQGVLTADRIPFILTNSRGVVLQVLAGWVADRRALGGQENGDALLQDRLGISLAELQQLKRKAPVLELLHPRRLGPCLDVLLGRLGLEPGVVLRRPALLYYSPHRLRQRAAVLHSAGVFHPPLLVRELLLSEERFAVKYAEFLHLGSEET